MEHDSDPHALFRARGSDGAWLWGRVDFGQAGNIGVPVVLLGPAEASHLRWPASFVECLANRVGPVIRFDYRDSGKSSNSEQNYDLAQLVDDCLLYTSPSPRDQRGSRMPSSA